MNRSNIVYEKIFANLAFYEEFGYPLIPSSQHLTVIEAFNISELIDSYCEDKLSETGFRLNLLVIANNVRSRNNIKLLTLKNTPLNFNLN